MLGPVTVADRSERELIELIRQGQPPPPDWLLVGIGDDAAVVEPERNRVDVTFKVTEGDVAHIQDIHIVGANAIKESTLLDQMELKYVVDDEGDLAAPWEEFRTHFMFRGEDDQRHRHEGGRDDRAPRGEGQLDPERVAEPAPDHPGSPERGQQRDPADDRREHERQDHERPQDAAPREARASQDPRERDAEQQRQRGGRERHDQRQPERRAGAAARQDLDEPPPRRASDQREHRYDDERRSEERERDDGEGEPSRHAISRAPARTRTPRGWPALAPSRR